MSRSLRALALVLSIYLASLSSRTAVAESVQESYPDGKPKVVYTTGDGGKRDGEYDEFYENGSYKLRAHYRAGQLDGPYVEFFEDGKVKARSTYKLGQLSGKHAELNERGQIVLSSNFVKGKLDGPLVHYENGKPVRAELFKNGELAASRSIAEVKKTLATILAKPRDDEDAALRKVAAYRYLCGLPYDLTLDDDYIRQTQAAAKVMEKLGRLDHNPPNPGGISDAEYELGKQGAGRSNLAVGPKTMAEAVDLWMNDSDKGNIEKVGHRRWFLNPPFKKTGFGVSGNYSAGYAFDNSGDKKFDYDFVCYPTRGVMPLEFFQSTSAWSVSLNPARFAPPDDKIEPKIFPINANLEKTGPALTLDYTHVDRSGFGVNNCIIFRPDKSAVTAGASYLVEINGLTSADGKTTGEIHYFVQFVNLSK